MFEIIRDMWEDGIVGKLTVGLMIFLILLIPASIASRIKEQKEWGQFAVTHNCKKVGHIKGHTSIGSGVGVTANGRVGTVMTTTTAPDKNGFACDDGVTYWR
jgi:hypothetical protein